MGVIAMKKFHSKKKTTKIIIECGNKKVVGNKERYNNKAATSATTN